MEAQAPIRKTIKMTTHYIIMAIFGLYFAFPMLFLVMGASKNKDNIIQDMGSWHAFWFNHSNFDNFIYILSNPASNFWLYFKNSVLITVITVILSVLVNSLIAFAVCRLRFKGKKIILTFIIAMLIIPFEAIATPLLMLMAKLPFIDLFNMTITTGWLQTLTVQIAPFIARAFPIYLFYQFFRDIPKEFDEAAYMDGATPFQVWWKIIMPLSKPVISTVIILEFLMMWNQYLWPVMTAPTDIVRPLQPGIQTFFSAQGPEWGIIMAYATLATIPVLAVFLLFQKHFIRSVMGTGVKG